MADFSSQTQSAVDVDRPLFAPLPALVEFRHYEPFAQTTAKLSLRNMDRVPRRVRILPPDTPFFSISGPRNGRGQEMVDSRIAPGTEVHYTVSFTPRDIDDYEYDLIVATEREKFIVPLRAVGKRGLLSFPDAVTFASTPVKSTSAKTIVVRNTGTRASEFRLTVAPPFYVTPERGFVDVDQNLPVTLSFTPTEAKPYASEMVVAYVEGGYEAAVAISSAGHDVPVHINTGAIVFPGTYVTLTDTKLVVLKNDSELPISFSWKAHRDAAEEKLERERRVTELNEQEAQEYAAILAAPDDDTLDVDGDGEDDLSESDDEDQPEPVPHDSFGPPKVRRGRTQKRKEAALAAAAAAAAAEAMSLSDTTESVGLSFLAPIPGSTLSGVAPDQSATNGLSTVTSSNGQLSVAKRAQIVAMKRKYRSLRKLAMEEALEFNSVAYDIQPSSGMLWARSEMEFSIKFAPQADADFRTVAWLDATGRSQRLPVEISGFGIGPKLTFLYDVVDVGNVCITSKHRYELRLLNKGSIDSNWTIEAADTLFGSKFSFEPANSFIRLGDEQVINVYFSSTQIGSFDETFSLRMQGSKEIIKVQFLGRVVPPTFQFDVDSFPFGRSPFSFTQSRRFALYNLSDVPFTYNLRVPQDGKRPPVTGPAAHAKHHSRAVGLPQQLPKPIVEFQITPNSGTIPPGGFHNLQLDFTPITEKRFTDYNLTIDIEDVGKDVLSVPISAESIVPPVEIANPVVKFGDCFLNFEYQQYLVLKNNGDLPAHYQVEPQDKHMATVASLTLEPEFGEVPAKGIAQISLRIIVKKHGPCALPISVKIAGAKGEPLVAEIQGNGRGPKITPYPANLDIGSVPCLTPTSKELIIHNDSLIPATVQLFMTSVHSLFRIDAPNIELVPGEKRPINISAILDDTDRFSDEICLNITDSEAILVPVTAKGSGTTMITSPDISSGIDFGQVFTATTGTFSFTLENKGRRSQFLTWTNNSQRMKDMAVKKAKMEKKDQGKPSSVPVLTGPVFSIDPALSTIKPKGKQTYVVSALNASAVSVKEDFECFSKSEGATKTVTIFNITTSAEFVNPLLEFSYPNGIFFQHNHTNEVETSNESVIQVTPMTMKNVTGLPIDFTLRTQAPFSLDAYDVLLPPGESFVVNVAFDPLYREDRLSHNVDGHILVIYRAHPRKDSIRLGAEIQFPNVVMERSSINFGVVLNDTASSQVIRLTNMGRLPAFCSWTLLEDPVAAVSQAAAAGLPYVPINQAFDILPIRCQLEPGQSHPVEFVFYGHPGRKFETKAICEVSGGPDYEVDLFGEANIVSFKVDRSIIEIGPTLWDKTEDADFIITNTGKIDYSYSISIDHVSRPGIIAVSPASGFIQAGKNQKVIVRTRPGLPGLLRETIVLTVAHFAPVDIVVTADASYGIITTSLPRDPSAVPGFEAAMREATDEFVREQSNAEVLAGQQTLDAPVSGMLSDDGVGSTVFGATLPRADVGGPPSTKAGSTIVSKKNAAPEIPALPMSMKIESNAARFLFARHLLAYTAAERAVVSAERAAGINRKGVFGEEDGVDGIDEEEKKAEEDLRRPGDRSKTQRRGDVRGEMSVKEKQVAISSPALDVARGVMKSLSHPSKFVVAVFICDVGNVVAGLKRTRQFTVTNIGGTSVSFSIDHNDLAGTGFEVNPTKVQRLVESESLEFNVEFEAQMLNRPDTPDGVGPVRVDCLVQLSKGPAIILSLRAYVTVPDLKFLPDSLDFGSVLRGQERVACFQVMNTSPTPAVFTLGNPIGSPPQVQDKGCFRFEPTDGSLQPGERCLIRAAFAPGNEQRPYGCTFPFKIQLNQRPRLMTLRGQGDDVSVLFSAAPEQDPEAMLALALNPIDDSLNSTVATVVQSGKTGKKKKTEPVPNPPLFVDIGPLKPAVDVGVRVITITNTSKVPIELYSLDFDAQYRAEDSVLSLIGDLRQADALLRLPSRKPGDPLQDEIVATARLVNPNAGLPYIAEVLSEEAAKAKSDEINGSLALASGNSARMNGQALNVLILNESTEASSLATRVAQSLGSPTPVISIDSSIQWAQSEQCGAEFRSEVAAALAAGPLDTGFVSRIFRARVERIDCAQAVVVDSLACSTFSVEEAAVCILNAFGSPGAGEFRVVVVGELKDPSIVAQVIGDLPTSQTVVRVDNKDDVDLTVESIMSLLPQAPDEPNSFNADLVMPPQETLYLKTRPQPDGTPGIMIRPSADVANKYRIYKLDEYVPRAAELMAQQSKSFETLPTTPLRWVLGPGKSTHAVLAFNSTSVGAFTNNLSFGVVGIPKEFAFTARGTVAVPVVNSSPDVVFMNKIKQRAERTIVSHKFILTRNVFEFGALQYGRKKTDRLGYQPPPPPEEGVVRPEDTDDALKLALKNTIKREKNYFELVRSLHCERLRFTNSGPFPVAVSFGLSGPDIKKEHEIGMPFITVTDELLSRPVKPVPLPPAGTLSVEPADSCFVIEPARVEDIGVGKSVDITVWSFPPESAVKPGGKHDGIVYMNTLVASLDYSPEVYKFNISAVGVAPLVELHGPWENFEGGKAPPPPQGLPALDANVPLIDFERIVVESSEDRTFAISNSGNSPILWRINQAALLAQQEADTAAAATSPTPLPTIPPFLISPMNGSLAPGQTTTVTVNFATHVEILRQHILEIEYTDGDCGFEYTETSEDAKKVLAAVSKPVVDPKSKDKKAAPVSGPAPVFVERSKINVLKFAVRGETYKVVSGVKFEMPPQAAGAVAGATTAAGAQGEVFKGLGPLPSALLASSSSGGGSSHGGGGGGFGSPSKGSRGGDHGGSASGVAAIVSSSSGIPLNVGHFDFGTIKVGQTETRQFPVTNAGKYPVVFKVQTANFLGSHGEELIVCHPTEGEVAPGQETKVTVKFNSNLNSVKLTEAKSIMLTISDAKSLKPFDQTLIHCSAESVFSKFSFAPSKGLNFGAIKYGESKERKIEIRNNGVYPFTYHIVLLGSPDDTKRLEITEGRAVADAPKAGAPAPAAAAAAPAPAAAAGKDKSRPPTRASPVPEQAPAPAPAEELKKPEEWGPFKVEPLTGEVKPGTSVFVSAKFVAEGARSSRTSARIHIQGFDFSSNSSDVLCYEFVGESCIPGINGNDWLGIFEEQGVVERLDELENAPLTTKVGRNTVHGSPDASPTRIGDHNEEKKDEGHSPMVLAKLYSRTRSGFSRSDRTFTFGTIINSQHPKGVVERFRISNTTKIPISVKFETAGDPEFLVTPSQYDIPMHESRYVEVRFTPSAIKKYSAVFKATVDHGTLPDTRQAEFSLIGEAALPTVSVIDPPPTARDSANGNILLNMGEIEAGHQKRNAIITVRNDGVFPAVTRFEMPPSRVFKLLGGSGTTTTDGLLDGTLAAIASTRPDGGRQLSLTLMPKQKTSIGVQFAPDVGAVLGASTIPSILAKGETPGLIDLDDAGAAHYASEVSLNVQHNPYMQEKVRVSGKTSAFDINFESSADLIVHLPEVDVSDPNGSSTTFTMRNGSERPIRFEWPSAPSEINADTPQHVKNLSYFSFSPKCGHLPVGASKSVTIKFNPGSSNAGLTGPVILDKFSIPLAYHRVSYSHDLGAAVASAERFKMNSSKDVRPATGGSKGSADAKNAAAAAAGKGAPPPAKDAKGGKAPSRPQTASGAGHAVSSSGPSGKARTRVGKRAIGPEPTHTWDSETYQMVILPRSDPRVEVALLRGTGVAVAGGSQYRIPVVPDEPAYVVIDDGPLFIEDVPEGQIATPRVEPVVVPVEEEEFKTKTQGLVVKAVSDSMRYELVQGDADAGGAGASIAHPQGVNINFRPTLMYQTRVHSFIVKNPSKTTLKYNMIIASLGHSRQGSVPFSIEPSSGSIAPDQRVTFKANFAPLDADDYDATCTMKIEGTENVNSQPKLLINLSGRSQRPIVHLDLPVSDYLLRRSPTAIGPHGTASEVLEEGTKALEVASMGIGVRNQKRFYIVNPTDSAYDFIFDPIGPESSSPSCPVRCITSRGMLLPGKRFEVIFEYSPLVSGTHEAFFRFLIPQHKLTQCLLVAGVVSEPRVSLDRSSIVFSHLLVGAHTTETAYIINDEAVPFAFEFLHSSFEAERNAVRINPMTGVVPAKGRFPVEVMMAPSEERFINANIALSIKRKPALIFLNVKGEGYDLHDRVMLQDEVSSTSDQRPGTESRSSGAALELSSAVLSSTGVNFVDFGTVQVNEKAVKRVMITNNGAFSFDFNWALGSSESLLAGAAGARALASTLRAARMQASPGRENQRAIRVTPEAGKVPKGGSITCELEFRPTSQVSIAGLALTCTVANVKKYQVSVSAVGGKPALEFSTVNLDFGDCIVLPPSMGVPAVAVTRLIRITNRESDRDVSLQCTFERRPHLDVGLDAAVLRPGDTIDVPVIFTPRATANYVETVPFEVNSLHTVNVNVTGEGVFCSFELVNAAHSDLSFGALRPSQTATRNVKIGNVCRRAILLDVVDEDGSLIPSTVNSPGGDIPRLRKKFVSAASTRLFAKGKDSTQLELTFSPPSRVPSFSEPLYVRVGAADNKGVLYGSFSDRIPLLKLSGACLGMDVMLEMDSIPFGSVCEGSSLTKLCHIYNGGDVPTSFKFDTNRFGRNFSISPATGFLPPHSDCQLRITFAPVRVGKDVRADDIRCLLDGAPDPLFLSLTGDCVPRPAPSGSTINFECKVRDSTSQNIKLPSNPTDQPWTLTPVLSNPFWTAPSVIEVPAKGSVDLPVTYKPLFMTVKDGPNEPPPALPGSAAAHDPTLLMVGLSVHTGTVFMPLPDGTGTLYNLSGKAQPPSNLAPISAKGTAKKSISFVVPIKNWLRSTQRFVVSWDSSKVPQAAQLKGARTIDVPGLGEREYKLSYTNALEGKSSIPLTFTNEGTGEYINTTLELETSAPGVEGEIKLTAPVRQIASHVISVPNALAASQTPITWNPWPPQCSNPAIRVTPLGNMRGMPDGSFRIDFRPRVPTKMPGGEEHVAGTPPPPPESAKLTLRSPELGDFNFDLLLSASACGPESLLHFSAPLGSSAKNLFRFRAFDAKPGQASGFTCKVDKPELFSVPATFSVPALPAGVEPWDGQDASVEVTFEGTSLSEKAVVGMLTINSDNSGSTWTVPLSGVCSTPRPSGPYNLTPTGPPVSINFRNVFNEEREFVVSTDVPQAFSISPVGVLKVAKKTTQALSVTYKAPSDGSSPRGKLIVSCPSAPGEPSWVFYLHGAPVEVIHAAQTTNPSRPASGAAKKK